ncbi:5' nucleotidase, NT5C type [Spongiibacter nanhainus]|nr:hypothetical protein [Spongiibacter nanhainus]
MDHVLCDYKTGFARHKARFPDLAFPQSEPGLYVDLDPLPGAIDSYRWLHNHPETAVFILTAPSIQNSHSYSEKRLWVERHLGMEVVENLIITPHKHLNRGDYLVDDMPSGKGQEHFGGELVLFGSKSFPDWRSVRDYFEERLQYDA